MTGVADDSEFLDHEWTIVPKNGINAVLYGRITKGTCAVVGQAVAYLGAMETLSVAFART